MFDRDFSYLALGDSYTIGEGLSLLDSFPYQVVRSLRRLGVSMNAPEIIAQTGWTSEELLQHMERHTLLPFYDFVTLLTGVNDQYRGRAIADYEKKFSELLGKAIALAADQPTQVIVISIPDWGCTPFADGKNREEIAAAIDHFNERNGALSEQKGVHYLEITSALRQKSTDDSLYTADRLHYSPAIYKDWSDLISTLILQQLSLQYEGQ
jgi:lysophospholipase L1-like esterase